MITLQENKLSSKIILISFYVLMIVFWLRMAYLGMQIYHLGSLGQAETLLNSNSMYVIKIINNAMKAAGDLWSFVKLSINDLALSWLVLVGLWLSIPVRSFTKRFIRTSLGLAFLVSALVLLVVVLAMQSGSFQTGVDRLNSGGIVVGFFSLFMVLITIVVVVLEHIHRNSSDFVE